jgi:hypothetical protein
LKFLLLPFLITFVLMVHMTLLTLATMLKKIGA